MTFRPLFILLGGCTLAGPVVTGNLDAPTAPDTPNSATSGIRNCSHTHNYHLGSLKT